MRAFQRKNLVKFGFCFVLFCGIGGKWKVDIVEFVAVQMSRVLSAEES